MRLVGSLRPVAVASWLRSATAVRESKPSSRKGWVGGMVSGSGGPRMAGGWVGMGRGGVWCGWAGVLAASGWASGWPAAVVVSGVGVLSWRVVLVSSASSGLGRCVVKVAGNASQSMSAMVIVVSLWLMAWCRDEMA